MYYKVVLDEQKLDSFIASLPELLEHEVWYVCLFGRHKYDPSFPNTRDSGQLVRITAGDKIELKSKIRRMEVPLGSYVRDNVVATNECLAAYIAVNPRSLIRANKAMLIELATRVADGNLNFSPMSLSTTCIHRAVDRKFYVDFDFDFGEKGEAGFDMQKLKEALPSPDMYRILRTRGGFHILVELAKVRELKTKWHPILASIEGCDVKGSNTLTPIPGCTQGGFTPYFMETPDAVGV